MVYIRELDDLPWEVRRSTSTTLNYWPKVDGRNVVVTSDAGVNRYEVYDPSGGLVQGSTALTPTTVSGVSRFSLAIPSIATLDERYQVRVYFRETGAGTPEQLDVRLFDVVLWPFGGPQVSLNDMLEQRADVRQRLNEMGTRLGYAAGDAAQEYAAAICAVAGRIALEARVRDAVVQDARSHSETTAPRTGVAARYTRPALVIDRQRLKRVELYEALAHLYRSQALQPEDGTDPASAAYRLYRDQSGVAWGQVGPLAYDAGETLQPSGELSDPGRVTYRTRRQA
jgi:hypothetical protein